MVVSPFSEGRKEGRKFRIVFIAEGNGKFPPFFEMLEKRRAKRAKNVKCTRESCEKMECKQKSHLGQGGTAQPSVLGCIDVYRNDQILAGNLFKLTRSTCESKFRRDLLIPLLSLFLFTCSCYFLYDVAFFFWNRFFSWPHFWTILVLGSRSEDKFKLKHVAERVTF